MKNFVTPEEVSDGEVDAFKKAWHEADERGETGSRVRAGIAAVHNYNAEIIDEHEDMPEPKAEPGFDHRGEQTLFDAMGLENP